MTDWPNGLIAATVLAGLAALLFAAGLLIDALPEETGPEWNGLPISEYGTGDVLGGVLALAVAGAICAAVSLLRAGSLTGWQRGLAKAIIGLAITAVVVVALIVAFAIALCGGGACD